MKVEMNFDIALELYLRYSLWYLCSNFFLRAFIKAQKSQLILIRTWRVSYMSFLYCNFTYLIIFELLYKNFSWTVSIQTITSTHFLKSHSTNLLLWFKPWTMTNKFLIAMCYIQQTDIETIAAEWQAILQISLLSWK